MFLITVQYEPVNQITTILTLSTLFIRSLAAVAEAFLSPLDTFSTDLLDLSRCRDFWPPLLLCQITTKPYNYLCRVGNNQNNQNNQNRILTPEFQYLPTYLSIYRAGPVKAIIYIYILAYLQGIFLPLFSHFFGRGSPLLSCCYLGAPQLFLALCGLCSLGGFEGLDALSNHIRSFTYHCC